MLPSECFSACARNLIPGESISSPGDQTISTALRMFDVVSAKVPESLVDAVVLFSEDGILLNLRAAHGLFIGYTVGHLVGKNLADFLHPSNKRQAARRMSELLRQGGTESECRLRFVSRQGSTRHIRMRGVTISCTDGTLVSYAVMCDVTNDISLPTQSHPAGLVAYSLKQALQQLLHSLVGYKP